MQETKCSFKSLKRISQRIWKGSSVMATDAEGMASGGLPSYGNLQFVVLSNWRAICFSLMEDFKILDVGTTGTIANIYGPSTFPQK